MCRKKREAVTRLFALVCSALSLPVLPASVTYVSQCLPNFYVVSQAEELPHSTRDTSADLPKHVASLNFRDVEGNFFNRRLR